ncbi:uncharacterized protein N7484_004278 [Penicillium longicatenatum]|uniref:uncharacterized protein n=1 Tax=Penicillium longicatenatum TaxID=1561947 RepID=UPI002546D40A|nr:uncharacterized protein N7484_004278 [Penicillium longicatenatum]KAJ5650555.1 hypothetical protein N7484_004278 [Penicillium longicatenatum]
MSDRSGDRPDPEDVEATPYSPYENELIAESGRVQGDGRVKINLDSTVARAIAESINYQQELRRESSDYGQRVAQARSFNLKLNIVIQIVGSRGDVQPFVALGNALQRHGHRVRIATHGVFADFIHSSGLEFFPIGGNPADLMAYMVKNPGLLPQMETLREGEICKKKIMIGEMLEGCWRSCVEHDPYTQEPFVADAIIANPPSFAHIHCAQALSIPTHLMFTMPWSSTKSFPHPLSSLTADPEYKGLDCWASYGVVEWLTWQGLADVVNKWRASIDLGPIPTTEGPSLHEGLKIPFTYCWSPALVPKPQDWPAYVDVCGFFFRDPPEYDPSPELQEFLLLGTPPIYVGFGSIVVDEPERLINTVLEAVKASGARAVISKGWSNMNGAEDENIFYIGDCPHEWLFQHVAAVVHHGGAGTTACGLVNGKPTAIVPFFGDQPFWGEMVANAGAGPRPIPHKALTIQNLTEAIKFCLTPEATVAAQELARKMQTECGVDEAVKSFHRNLPLERMRCMIIPDQVAVWNYKKNKRSLNLSKMAVQTLIEYSRIDTENLQWYVYLSDSYYQTYLTGRSHDINPITIENRRWDPLTGVISAGISTGTRMLKTSTGMLYEPFKELRRAKSSPASERNQPIFGSSENVSSLRSTSTTSQTGSERATSPRSPLTTAGDMAGASLNSFGKFTTGYFKGVLVDIPTAAADGFRHVSQVYGDKPKEYGTVTDWKSGAKVGSKNFVGGMKEGITGLVKHPWKGYQEDGRQGALRGLAKGAIGVATKASSAGIGIWAYPSQGIARSIEAKFRGKTRKAVVVARLMDGYAQTIEMQLSEEMKQEIVREFDRLMGLD